MQIDPSHLGRGLSRPRADSPHPNRAGLICPRHIGQNDINNPNQGPHGPVCSESMAMFDSNGAPHSDLSSKPTIHTSASWTNFTPARFRGPRLIRGDDDPSDEESELDMEIPYATHPKSNRPYKPYDRYQPGRNRPTGNRSAPLSGEHYATAASGSDDPLSLEACMLVMSRSVQQAQEAQEVKIMKLLKTETLYS